MIKYLVLFFALFTQIAAAQNPCPDQFIEIEITDTVSLAPQQISFAVTIDGYYAYTDDGTGANSNILEEEKLKRLNFETKLIETLNFGGYPYQVVKDQAALYPGIAIAPKTYSIEFKKLSEMEEFQSRYPAEQGIIMQITQMSSPETATAEKAAYKKALQNGKQKAQLIANAANVKLGKVLQIKEITSPVADWTAYPGQPYPPNGMVPDYSGNLSGMVQKIEVKKTLLLRFAIE